MIQSFPDKHLPRRHPRFHSLNNLMGGGYRRNSLTIVAARTRVGKTTWMLGVGSDFAEIDVPVLFLDTEMSGEEMVSRELSNVAGLDEHYIIAGKYINDLTGTSAQSVQAAAQRIKDKPFFYTNIAGKPVEYAISIIRQFVNQHVGSEELVWEGQRFSITRPCVVLYDWLKLPSAADLNSGAKEYQLLGDICSKLKDAAKHMNVPVICGAQQNRGAVGRDESEHIENAEPYIASSDRLAQFCNTLCVLRNPTLKMADEIDKQFGNARPLNDPEREHPHNAWKFNQIFQGDPPAAGPRVPYGHPDVPAPGQEPPRAMHSAPPLEISELGGSGPPDALDVSRDQG